MRVSLRSFSVVQFTGSRRMNNTATKLNTAVKCNSEATTHSVYFCSF